MYLATMVTYGDLCATGGAVSSMRSASTFHWEHQHGATEVTKYMHTQKDERVDSHCTLLYRYTTLCLQMLLFYIFLGDYKLWRHCRNPVISFSYSLFQWPQIGGNYTSFTDPLRYAWNVTILGMIQIAWLEAGVMQFLSQWRWPWQSQYFPTFQFVNKVSLPGSSRSQLLINRPWSVIVPISGWTNFGYSPLMIYWNLGDRFPSQNHDHRRFLNKKSLALSSWCTRAPLHEFEHQVSVLCFLL